MSVVNLADIEGLRVVAGTDKLVRRPLKVFSDEAIAFLGELSSALLKDRAVRALPDAISFAYWCRKANLVRQRDERRQSLLGFDMRLGRGLALHIAPSNVPVNFAFTYAFSLISGNASVVRVPSKPFAQVEAILGALRVILDGHPRVAERTAFVSYDSSSVVTASLSLLSDVRVIWGGDQTVASIRQLPTTPRCVDVCFADRYSIALVRAEAVVAAGASELAKLAQDFYNDTYLMDQNACSSPRTILWLGENIEAAKKLFWGAVDAYARTRYELQPAVVMDKYVQECGDFMRGSIESACVSNGVLTVAELAGDAPLSTELRGKGGYFYERTIRDLADVEPYITERYQTITYFGVDAEAIRREVVERGLLGIDRVVPMGQAMDVGLVWDGYDLASMMSRVVDAR